MRAKALAESVREWIPDPSDPSRQMGWVSLPADLYCRPVRRSAVRCRKKNGQWGYGINLGASPEPLSAASGGVCTRKGIKQDKQGLGTSHRNKKRFEAQQILIQLEALAHNILVWARQWLMPQCPKLAHLGIKRLVRDVFQIEGFLIFDQPLRLLHIYLNRAHPLAKQLALGLSALLAYEQIAVSLGET